MNINNINHIYFLGIGGIGMSALARFFASQGKIISGYDRTHTPLCEELEREGMTIHYVENIELLPKEIDLIIYTPAIPKDHAEFVHLQKTTIPILKRSEVLGIITQNMLGVCVAGTHGKTTISSMIAHLLTQSKIKCNAFLGGISKNYNSNLVLCETSKIAVIEADEFDRSFL
jgi:UDP-N-acetylmuramate--alanine ligase